MGQGRSGWVRGFVCHVLGLGGLCWGKQVGISGLGGCFGLGQVGFGLARGSVGIGRDGFCDKVGGGLGWNRWGSQVGGLGFGGRWVLLGHGDLGCRVRGLFWACLGLV